MKSQNSLFVIFCLCLTVGLLGAYATFVGHFDGHQENEIKLISLRKQVEEERFNNSLLAYQLKDFQQTVAQTLPANEKLQAHYELRNLSAVTRIPASEDQLDLSGVIYEKGKQYFKGFEYEQAIAKFSEILEKYPLSKHSVEARFFIAESYFLKKDYHRSLSQIEEMVTQYPQHDLTGFILLRMGQISEINSQPAEASEVYRTVAKSFGNPDLKKQARKLAQSLE